MEKWRELIIGTSCVVLLGFFLVFQFRISLNPPVLSADSGFYEEAFYLEMGNLNPDVTIYYTLDGTVPDESSEKYTEPIKIYDYSVHDNTYSSREDVAFEEAKFGYVWTPKEKVRKAMVVKAIAINKYGFSSDVVTGVYFIGEAYGDLPVLSILVEPEDFWGYDSGIYIKGKVYDDWLKQIGGAENIVKGQWGYPSNMQISGKEAERDAVVEIFENTKSVYRQELGIRIRGGATRYFEQKSFTLYARDKYGKDEILYELFENNPDYTKSRTIDTFDTFILRNWGNSFRTHMFMDPLVQHLVSDRAVSVQNSRTCVVFLNGEYWGLYDMKEKYDAGYFENHYGIDENNLIAVKYEPTADGSGRAVIIGDEDDISEFEYLENFVEENDLSTSENYDRLCEIIDIDSYIDMYALRIYVEAVDFPFNNVIYWKTKGVTDQEWQDGKWRLALYDVDPDLNYPNYYNGFMRFTESAMFEKLLGNSEFVERFVTRMCDMINQNFRYDRCEGLINQMQEEVLPYICEYYERYGPIGVGDAGDEEKINYYNSLCDDMRNFFYNQPKYMRNLLREEGLILGDMHELQIDKDTGELVQINSLMLDENERTWKGIYFSDFPVTITAFSENGKTFAGWMDGDGNIISTDRTLQLTLNTDIKLRAVYE